MNKRHISLAIFDFDDTLVVNPIRFKKWRGYEKELVELNSAENKDKLELYSRAFAPSRMVDFVKLISSECVSYVVSHEISSQWVEPKKMLTEKYYGHCFKDIITAGSYEAKISIVKALMTYMDLCPNEVLFVDDNALVQELAKKEGFTVVSPIEILGYESSVDLAKSILAGY